MAALGTNVRMTVFRKLAQLPYLTSYSHRGKYYTLKPLCRFDGHGLWSHGRARFSIHSTLLDTGKALVEQSAAGYCVAELDEILHVDTKQALRHLYIKSLVRREKITGRYVYFANHEIAYRRQMSARREMTRVAMGGVTQDVLAHEFKAAIVLFFSLLDERQRRFYAGLESLKIGRGGDTRIGELLGIDPHTVAKGRAELLRRDIDVDRLRKRGGGRPSVEKKRRR